MQIKGGKKTKTGYSTAADVLEKLAPEAAKKFLPASEYERAGSVDYARMAEVQRAFSEAYLQAMKG